MTFLSGLASTVLLLIWAGLTTLAAPALRGLLRRRASRGKEIRGRLPERRGIDPLARPSGCVIWIHAASVGETLSILPVLTALAGEAPDAALLVTTGTVTSADLLARRLPALGLSEQVRHRFIPLDVPAWISRFLDHWRPDAAAFVESELWPNTLVACRRRSIPLALINARMSRRSFTAWSRVPWAVRPLMAAFANIFARGDLDAERFRRLGAPHTKSVGDLKLAAPALPVDPGLLTEMKRRLAGRPIFLAASTHPGEEALIAQVHEALGTDYPTLVTIIAPRHPERGPELAAALRAPRRAAGPPARGGIWIADTLGELGLWYRLADVVFMGRSLIAPGGGQNPLEPARLGRAIATGPHVGNFAEHVEQLSASGGLAVVSDRDALINFVGQMLGDPARRRTMEARAKEVADGPAGLPVEMARALLLLANQSVPVEDAAQPICQLE